MIFPRSPRIRLLLWPAPFVIVLGATRTARAQVIASDWNTGNGQWHVQENWAPAEVPDNADGRTYLVQIGDRAVATGAQVNLVSPGGGIVSLTGLTMVGIGSSLSTNGFRLSVSGQTAVDGASTLTVKPSNGPTGFVSGTLVLAGQGTLELMEGAAAVQGRVTVGPATQITGNGLLLCGNADQQIEKALDNAGKITCRSHSPAIGGLTLRATGLDTLDLDGGNEAGIVEVANTAVPGQSDALILTVDGPLSDAFSGKLIVGQHDIIEFTKDFALSGADITLTGGEEAARIGGAGKITSAAATTFRVSGRGVIGNNLTLSGTANKVLTGAGGALDLRGAVTISAETLLPVLGTGRLDFSGGLTVNAQAEIQSTGIVSLDGGSETTGAVVNVNAPLSIYTDTLDAFGRPGFQDVLTIDSAGGGPGGGRLQVALGHVTDTWRLAPEGVLRLQGGATLPTLPTLLAGAGVRVEGRMEVTGVATSTAQVTVPGGGVIELKDSYPYLRLAGGVVTAPIVGNAGYTLPAGTNRLEGGTVAAPLLGTLRVDYNRVLSGYGSVEARVDASSATVLADGGTLTLSNAEAPVVSAGLLGVSGAGSVLNIPAPWYTLNVPQVWLGGGEIRGGYGTISPLSRLTGFGRVTAPLLILGTVLATGGTLVLEAGGSSSLNGTLRAEAGTLEIRGGGSTRALQSHLNIGEGGTVFFNGIGVNMQPESFTEFVGGTLRCSQPLKLAGTVFAFESATMAPSIVMEGDALLDFGTANINLLGDLHVTARQARVRWGQRNGTSTGALIFESGSNVMMESGAVLNCNVENHGRLGVGVDSFPSPIRSTFSGFQQSAGGVLTLPICGPDSLTCSFGVENAAHLAGTLELTMGLGYIPQEGDRRDILTAGSGIIGKFGRIVQPPGLPPGLMFVPDLTLFPDVLHLTLTATTPYELWRKTFRSLTDPQSIAKGADPDGDGLPNIGEFALHGNPSGGADTLLHPRVIMVNGAPLCICTLPVRTGALPDPSDPPGGPIVLHHPADALHYSLQASADLLTWNTAVTELTGTEAIALNADLPPLDNAWEYRTFAIPGEGKKYLRVVVTE